MLPGEKSANQGVKADRVTARRSTTESSRRHKLENRLAETLEQQTATSEILRVIARSPGEVGPVFDTIARSGARLCEAQFCFVYRFTGVLLDFVAQHGLTADGIEAMRRAWPRIPDRGSAVGRSVLAAAVEHIPDVRADPEYELGGLAEIVAFRSTVAVPMVRDGRPIGAISVSRSEAGPFPERQIELLKVFAEQAVIAIENSRLFDEVQARNRELTETLEQQTATSEILRVISSSPTKVQPVFDAIVASAVRLCGARMGAVYRFDGELVHLAAHHNYPPEVLNVLRQMHPRSPQLDQASGRAILTRSVAQIEDMLADPLYPKEVALAGGWRSILAVPLLRDGAAKGAIVITRSEVGPFAEGHVALLQTFADQAVIAIENARLFNELEARNRDLAASLEQQTATSEALKVISRSTFNLQPVLQTLVENAVRLCNADWGIIWRFDGEALRVGAWHGGSAAFMDSWQWSELRPSRGSGVGRAALERRVVHIADVLEDPEYELIKDQKIGNWRTVLCVPMLREDTVIGVFDLCCTDVRAFTDKQIDLVATFADQAVIAIENVRLFQELETRNRELTESLEQQTATSEILRVISSSPTNVQPVFDTIAQNAARLCEALDAVVYRVDGDALRPVAHHGSITTGSVPLVAGTLGGRTVIERRIIHVADVRAETDTFPMGAMIAQREGTRSMLSVPLMLEGAAIGTIGVRRNEVRPFTEKHAALLQTFAAQAVIAVENARLFQELETRTRELTRSVGELRALGEVSQAVGSTLDLETVLATIVSHAVQLSGSDQGVIYEFEEATQTFHARATHRITQEHLAAVRAAPIRLGEGAVGRAGVIREPVQIADIRDEQQLVAPQTRSLVLREGLRALLAIPLIREERLLGGLVILRRERGTFSSDVVATLQTFAAQSVLAIHNAGLFREVQRQKQYSEALVQTSPVAIATMDLDGTVVGWNPGAERLFGYTQAEALGRPMEDLVATPEVRDEVRTNIRRTLEGEWIRAIARRARKDGSVVDVEISSMPVIVEGTKVGMIGIYHDITELLRARREAEAANEAKSAFLATMSHEIRTPMNAVIGMSGLLLNTPLTQEQREYAEVIRHSGDTLLTVINDVLDFSKIEAGKLELESQPFDLVECIESALDLVAARAAEKGLDLAYQVGGGLPAAIVGDVTRLRQILLNLLSNAVKFTEAGEVVLSVSARRLDGAPPIHELVFAVRDTGIGIPPERLGRLFQSFSQVDASTSRRYGGTGLGLAIGRRLVELMGGRIAVSSEVGTGSEFRFTIRAPAAAAPLPTHRDLRGVQPSLRGKRALVVDDNATNRRILSSHLEAWGMQVRATASPAEALEWIRADEPCDVGILDMHMPEMDGLALARAIREQTRADELPLVLFTSLGRPEAHVGNAAFAACLHKPTKPSQLFDTLVSILADRAVHVPLRGVAPSGLLAGMAGRHPLRILVAEDNVVNQKVALRLLEQMGYRADVAANGVEAVDAVARQAYDVVLMDVQMPGMDGFEASREINGRWPGAGRPRLVAMTANAMQGDRELCVAAGMDDYIAKPIRIDDLVAALERCRRRAAMGAAGTPAAGLEGAPAVSAIDRMTFDRLASTMGGPFVAELIDTFVEDARQLVATLRGGLAETNVDAFRRAAHSLKSNGQTLGALGLAAVAGELEAMARTRRADATAWRLEQLVEEYERVVQSLGELRRGLPA